MSSSMYGGTGLRGGGQGDVVPKGYRKGSLSNFTPEQSQLFQDQFSNFSPDSYMSRLAGGDESLFDEMEAPAMRQFNGIQGNIASRFSGMGSGARRSSGFQNEITSSGSNFAQDLQSRRQELQRNAIKDLHGMSQDLLGVRANDNFLVEKQQQPNYWGQIGGALAGAVPGAIAGFMGGGPVGAVAGAGVGAYNGYNSKASYAAQAAAPWDY